MLEFNAEIAQLLENTYQGRDITRRRHAVLECLEPALGDKIADIGCGNGMLTLELARAVGKKGKVVGIEPSLEMRKLAIERCADFPQVEFLDGVANLLPLEDTSLDKAVSLQVFEYLKNIPGAVAEAHRVLKPGGRLVVGDFEWDTWSWYSADPERMTKMMEAWDRHLVERRVPAILPDILDNNGFVLEQTKALPFHDTKMAPDGLAFLLLHLIESYVINNELVEESVANAWAEEQRELAEKGKFFFSITHFQAIARKAA
ncbi:MAG: methyltransferase domain-containing protein [Pseudomonadota bacterium]